MNENTGIIKKLSTKGFGFITAKGRNKDLFFHAMQLKECTFANLKEGDQISFDGIEPTDKGEQAFGVRLITE